MSSADLRVEIQERLNYVIDTKQEAVHQTIEYTENCLAKVGEMKALFNILSSQKAFRNFKALGDINFADHSLLLLEEIQRHLTDILMAQGYQDLTGQVLKRVIDSLEHLQAGNDYFNHEDTHQGLGPGVTAKDRAGRIDDQDEVDDLLKNLGL